jgi:hypothetical protein
MSIQISFSEIAKHLPLGVNINGSGLPIRSRMVPEYPG